jgi:PAS domain S-box-containing protein
MMDLPRVLENLPVGVWVGRVPTGEVAYANREFRAILGMDAVVGVGIEGAPATYGIFDRLGRPFPVEQLPFSRVVATGRPATVDGLVIHRPDGRRVDVRAFAFPDLAADGRLANVVVAFIDITQEVAAEEERRRTESRLALAVNHAPIAVWATDAAGIVTVSEGAGLKSLGVKSGDLVGKNIFDLYREHSTISDYVRRGLGGDSFSYTVEVGEAVYDTWLTPVRDDRGGIVGVAGLSHDVSEIRKLQAAAIQNDRVIALGTLAASVAHEVNNPLTYMLGHLELIGEALDRLERDVEGPPGPRRALVEQLRRSLEPVVQGTRRIAGITRELRTFSRPAGEERANVDVRAVVGSVLKLVGKELEARARLHVDLRETAPVRGNETRLVQAVLNLVVNALQALPEGRLDGNEIWVATGEEAGRVVVEVADNGPGVPPADRERIFEPFVTTKEVGKGSGLGLFVSRNIVRGLSGEVEVADRPGGGARFRVVLPVSTEPGVPEPPAPLPASASGRILVVDDEAPVREALRERLVAAGYRAETLADGASALDRLLAGGAEYDLVYCDLMMTGTSGMDLAEALETRAPTLLARFVYMSGGAFTPRARSFRERHAERCVDKPFDVVAETARRLAAR